MENEKLASIWSVWWQTYDTTSDLTERLIARDVLDVIRALVEEKVVLACVQDSVLNPDAVVRDVLKEIGIKYKEFAVAEKR